ncbi:MAG: lysylphosphatidylglycerol synthase transmembrane domain-containing protein [Candidatus Pacebacteria bacterium]|nr:lysylphosphatidylglycerol synthase transmembrane domain-containing protein [Candidatus Paceibacterota bacterium]
MNKPFLLVLFSFILGAVIFVFLGKWIGWEEIGRAFDVFTGWQGLVVVLLTFLIISLGTLRWKTILNREDIKISLFELFKIYLGGYAIMYMFPTVLLAGEVFRVYGLGKKKNLNWSKTASSVIIERILEWTINLSVVILGLSFFLFKKWFWPKELLIVFGGAFLFFSLALVFFYSNLLTKKSIVHLIVKKFSGREISENSSFLEVENMVFNFFRPQNKALYKGFLISLFRAAVMQLRVWLLIWFLGANIGFFNSFAILGFSYVSGMVPIPTSLGSHEAIQAAAFLSIGLTASLAAAFALIIRAAEVLISSFGLIYIIKTGFNLMSNKFFLSKNEDKQDS